jgi:hypothetical protein
MYWRDFYCYQRTQWTQLLATIFCWHWHEWKKSKHCVLKRWFYGWMDARFHFSYYLNWKTAIRINEGWSRSKWCTTPSLQKSSIGQDYFCHKDIIACLQSKEYTFETSFSKQFLELQSGNGYVGFLLQCWAQIILVRLTAMGTREFWSKADLGGRAFVEQRLTFCPRHLYLDLFCTYY